MDACQRAIYARLTSDATLMSMVTGVFDDVPEGQPAPYVTLTTISVTHEDRLAARGWRVRIEASVWSRYRGWLEAQRIAGRIERLLHRQPLVVAGYEHIETRLLEHVYLAPPGGYRRIASDYLVDLDETAAPAP